MQTVKLQINIHIHASLFKSYTVPYNVAYSDRFIVDFFKVSLAPDTLFLMCKLILNYTDLWWSIMFDEVLTCKYLLKIDVRLQILTYILQQATFVIWHTYADCVAPDQHVQPHSLTWELHSLLINQCIHISQISKSEAPRSECADAQTNLKLHHRQTAYLP